MTGPASVFPVVAESTRKVEQVQAEFVVANRGLMATNIGARERAELVEEYIGPISSPVGMALETI